jgi:hypothetical protein
LIKLEKLSYALQVNAIAQTVEHMQVLRVVAPLYLINVDGGNVNDAQNLRGENNGSVNDRL